MHKRSQSEATLAHYIASSAIGNFKLIRCLCRNFTFVVFFPDTWVTITVTAKRRSRVQSRYSIELFYLQSHVHCFQFLLLTFFFEKRTCLVLSSPRLFNNCQRTSHIY